MVKKTSQMQDLKEGHLDFIMRSLYKNYLKWKKKELKIPYDYLAVKISDTLQISQALAKDYLKILDSRDLIRIEKKGDKIVTYTPKKIEESFDIDKYFNEVKKSKIGK